MSSASSFQERSLLERALSGARDTQFLTIDPGARHQAAHVFTEACGPGPAVIVADHQTFAAAGSDVAQSFHRAGVCCESFLFGPDVRADSPHVERLETRLRSSKAVPVAVGSGTINDLTKLAAHRVGRPYLVVTTAASMDGYTAFAASITHIGFKQSFSCPAPRAVVADLDVIARAPRDLNAAGYADLFAKSVAGADWLLADAMGIEMIDPNVWAIVQNHLPSWVESPGGIARAERDSLRHLTVGLLLSGFAMQAAQSSRPASGAEHQFSHLWDSQRDAGPTVAPWHGFQVGIGTLAALGLYEALLRRDMTQLDIANTIARWPSLATFESRIRELFEYGELRTKALEETRAKHPSTEALKAQLSRLCRYWPELRERLTEHLQPFRDARAMLRAAGCPTDPEQIGISYARLRQSYEQAYFIRRRFTVLDCMMRLGLFETAVDEAFGPGGAWHREEVAP